MRPKVSFNANAWPRRARPGFIDRSTVAPGMVIHSPAKLRTNVGAVPIRCRQIGFTLIEIMVVIVIIGILATFISLSIGSRSTDDRLQSEANRLEQLVAFATEQAQVQGMEMGLRTTTTGFEFLSQGNEGNWLVIEDGMLRPREIAEPFYIELAVEGQKIKPVVVDRKREKEQREKDEKNEKEKDDAKLDLDTKPKNRIQPQVFLLSSGDATAFELDLRLKNYPAFYRLDCDVLSRCTLARQQDRR